MGVDIPALETETDHTGQVTMVTGARFPAVKTRTDPEAFTPANPHLRPPPTASPRETISFQMPEAVVGIPTITTARWTMERTKTEGIIVCILLIVARMRATSESEGTATTTVAK